MHLSSPKDRTQVEVAQRVDPTQVDLPRTLGSDPPATWTTRPRLIALNRSNPCDPTLVRCYRYPLHGAV